MTRFKIYTRFSKTEQQIDKFYILIFEFFYVVLRLNSRITQLKPWTFTADSAELAIDNWPWVLILWSLVLAL